MRKKLFKTILSVICFCFFMTLAAGSGCEGCDGSYDTDYVDTDSLIDSTEIVTPIQIDESKEIYSADIDEDEREEEETYQSESDDEYAIEEENDNDTIVERNDD